MCALQKCHYKTIDKFFFFKESFNLWRPLLMMALYHQSKTPISFWVFCSMCKISLFLFNLVGDLRYVTIFLHLLHHQRTVPNVIGESL